jgi:archaellum biogenesis ATPase FlaH
MGVEKYLKQGKIIVFVVSNKNYIDRINDITLAVTKTSKNVIYVSLNKPYNILVETFEKKKIDVKKLSFIDCVSGRVSKPKDFKVSFVSSPKALTELSITMNEMLKPAVDAMIFDSLSTLLVYDDPSTVVKFAHSVISKIRTTNKEFVIVSLSEDADKNVLKDIGMFVDKVVALK